MRYSDTIVVVASGPSLTKEQTDMANSSGLPIMAINDNYTIVDADFLFAADVMWWYRNYVKALPKAKRLMTLDGHPEHLEKRLKGAKSNIEGIPFTRKWEETDTETWSIIHHGGNSGYLGVQVCARLGFKKIILIGFDHQHTNDMKHWFGDHDKTYYRKNAENVELWTERFDILAQVMVESGLDLVNCSLETSITGCRRSSLEHEL